MKRSSKRLCSQKLVVRYLTENGADGAALADIREHYNRIFKDDLTWFYPLSEGSHAGGFMIPVKEGVLWLPYDWMEKEAGPLFDMAAVSLLNAEKVGCMRDVFLQYSLNLCLALSEAQNYLLAEGT